MSTWPSKIIGRVLTSINNPTDRIPRWRFIVFPTSTFACISTANKHANLILHLLALLLRHPPELHGIPAHAQVEALLQTAVLASVPVHSINGAVLLSGALIGDVLRLTSAEEPLKYYCLFYLFFPRGTVSFPFDHLVVFSSLSYKSLCKQISPPSTIRNTSLDGALRPFPPILPSSPPLNGQRAAQKTTSKNDHSAVCGALRPADALSFLRATLGITITRLSADQLRNFRRNFSEIGWWRREEKH